MRAARHPLSRSRRSERGAVAIIVAISMVALVLATALVIDFGIVRVDRQMNKAAADSAASAGVRALDTGDGYAHPFLGVCQALRYLRQSDPELATVTGVWTDGNGAPPTADATGDGCTSVPLAEVTCEPGDESTWARYEGTADGGRISVRIQSGYLLDDGNFSEENLPVSQTDIGDSAQMGCDHLAVIVSEVREPGLGSLATSSDLSSRIRSVGRISVGEEGEGAVALLLLERTRCAVLDADGAGSGILVKGNGDMPGMIHADSLGNGSNCTSQVKVLDGNHPNGIVAKQAESGSPPLDAVISVRALSSMTGAVPGNASDPYDDVVAEPAPPNGPVGRGLITRSPVDNRWLNGVRTAVAAAAANWVTPPPPSPTVAWETTCTGGAGPSNPLTTTAPTVVFDCADAGKNYPNVQLAATTVIFRQNAYISANFTMPNASAVYVRGVPGGNAIDVRNNASFQMHTSGRTVVDPIFPRPVCTEQSLPGRARLMIGAGSVNMSASSAHMQMCHTTTIMMGNQADACLPSTTPTPPTSNLCDSFLNVTGGDLDWTAPDEMGQMSPTESEAHWDALEDLAFWSESEDTSSSTNHRIMGGGNMHLAGVFVVPNADPVIIGGGGVQDVENSQYVARRLTVNGGGVLDMQPDPADSFTIPIIEGFQLVR